LRRPGVRLLDAGCGTGGFLSWVRADGSFERIAGSDVSPQAIELAHSRVPEVELHVAPISVLPFEDGSFDLVVLNDVLQHVHEEDVDASLSELRRVVDVAGALLVRTNGARRGRPVTKDWRIYGSGSLRAPLEGAGL